ncbi:MAG: PilZ domain-containing protein [Sphingomonadales bacterium]
MFERSIVLVRAMLETENGDVRVFLRNLSRSGALIDTSDNLPIGSIVTLRCGKSVVPARVVWAKRPRFGLAFRDLISDTEVQRHVAPERSRPPTRGRPPSSRREAGRVAVP